MTIEQIKKAVDEGKPVCWKTYNYHVVKDSLSQYLIVCQSNDHTIGLTNRAGDKLNGLPEQFFIA